MPGAICISPKQSISYYLTGCSVILLARGMVVQNKKLVYLPLLAKLKVKTFTVGLLFTGCY